MIIPTAYENLLQKVHRLHDLEKISSILSWDRQVSMPKAGNEARAQQAATLRAIIHTEFVSDEMGDLIAAAAEAMAGADYDSTEASLIRRLQQSYTDERKLPADFVTRFTTITGQAEAAWEEARAGDDFAVFAPWLEQIIALAQEKAEYYGYKEEKYDALLDKYEPGLTTTEVRAIFQAAREALVPLRRAIADRGRPVDDSFLYGHFETSKQQEFARYLAGVVGYDMKRGHLGTSVHPFSTSFNQNDVRITARWDPGFINPSLFGTLHEAGHAIYEQNTGPELARTPLARGAWMGFHESQSRLVENIVGRSRGFWQAHFGQLQATFPEQLAGVRADEFFRAVNKVEASLIRVEADELTYNLHIILRFELEQAMINGDLTARNLPAAWNEGIASLLGITPPDDRQGCLQDIHWSAGSFGYFPTYALGNLYAAQLFEAALADSPEIEHELNSGEISQLMDWLHEKVHRHGRKYLPVELMVQATGRPPDHQAFIRYATRKFSDVYDL
jgi:carboxypeptidase Taq